MFNRRSNKYDLERIGFHLRKNVLPTLIMLIALALSMAMAAKALELIRTAMP